ncbi:MAG TPA: phosphatase PAP2 family protein [Acidobacteriota bacterium]|nr:phosphatase PAP2 family protein [Acidobacteriota bacterium]
MKSLFSRILPAVRQVRIKGIWEDTLRSLRRHMLLIALVAGYVLALLITAQGYGVLDFASLSLYPAILPWITAFYLLIFLLGHAIYAISVVGSKDLFSWIYKDLRSNYWTRRRLLNAAPVFLVIPVFMSAFTSFKTMIPVMHPFSWDAKFAAWDMTLHGGIHPWEALHSALGNPIVISVINVFYNLWMLVLIGVFYWQVFTLRFPRVRMQFLLTFLLAWILLGTVGAAVFSSAGPCYYGQLVAGENPYARLLAYLNEAGVAYPVWAISTQEMLWKMYIEGKLYLGSGISAMPSMHVSMAFLFFLVARKSSRRLGVVFGIYTLFILAGSVHLAWHYAIDSYVSILLTWLIWCLVGASLERRTGDRSSVIG